VTAGAVTGGTIETFTASQNYEVLTTGGVSGGVTQSAVVSAPTITAVPTGDHQLIPRF